MDEEAMWYGLNLKKKTAKHIRSRRTWLWPKWYVVNLPKVFLAMTLKEESMEASAGEW